MCARPTRAFRGRALREHLGMSPACHILLLQSAVEGVPREALEREGVCFLDLDGKAQTGRTISIVPSAGILPSVDPSFRFTPSSRMIDPR